MILASLGAFSRVFDRATVALLRGTADAEPQCEWTSATRVRARLTGQSGVVVGSTLTARPFTVHPTSLLGQPLASCDYGGAD
eukprot:2422216-Prymnesium_polylepis.1